MSDPVEGAGRSEATRVLLWCLLFAALVRLAVFFLAYNYDGDPLVRTYGALAWSQSPYLITHADHATWVFGPLPFYLNGLALQLWHDAVNSPRTVSLLFGILAVVPFFRLTQREFGPKPALYATVAFCLYTLHVRYSAVTTSEAINAFLLLSTVYFAFLYLRSSRWQHFAASVILMNLATMVRYENVLLVIVLTGIQLGAAVTSGLSDRWPIRFDLARVRAALLFAALSLLFLATRLIGDYLYNGDPLYSVAVTHGHFQAMQERGIAERGSLWHHLYTLAFWPGVTILSLSPVVGLLAFGSAAQSLRQKQHLAYLAIPIGFLAAFVVQGTILKSMATFARYSLPLGIFLLPLAGDLWHRWLDRRSQTWRRTANGVMLTTMLVWFVLLALIGIPESGALADKLSSVSPVSRLPLGMMSTVDWINGQLPDSARLLIDDHGGEGGLIRMYCRLPQERMLLEWKDQKKIDSFLALSAPSYLITFSGGELAKSWGLTGNPASRTVHGYALTLRMATGGFTIWAVRPSGSWLSSPGDGNR
jgi:hypothetical protein